MSLPLRELRAQLLKVRTLVESAAALGARWESHRVLSRRAEESAEQLEQALLGTHKGSLAAPEGLVVARPVVALAEGMAHAKARLEALGRIRKEQERLRTRQDEANLLLAATEARIEDVARETERATVSFRRELEKLGMAEHSALTRRSRASTN